MPEPGSVLCWVYEANCVVCPVLKESGGEVRKQADDHGTEGYSLTGIVMPVSGWAGWKAGHSKICLEEEASAGELGVGRFVFPNKRHEFEILWDPLELSAHSIVCYTHLPFFREYLTFIGFLEA